MISIFTPIKLDKTRNLRFGMKAISLIEKALGTNIAKIDFENLTMEQLATVIWAGLVHEDKELTVDRIMELVDEHSSVQMVVDVMIKAVNEAFGTSEASDEKN